MEAVKNGFSIKKAAEVHKVPRTTLQDRVLGYVNLCMEQDQVHSLT